MGRIRTIKPEFPQSEGIGRLTRDARLTFIQIWTIVDDQGRTRAASRMLASLLYPYDDDAPRLIDGWLEELEAAGFLLRYEVNGLRYLEVVNWGKHQKIDRASPSKFPPPPSGSTEAREPSRTLDEPSTHDREPSRTIDAGSGPRTRDLDQDLEKEAGKPASARGLAREPAASQPLSDDLEFQHAATEALGGGKVRGSFAPMVALTLDRVRVVEVLRRESAVRPKPIGKWELAATVATEQLAAAPSTGRASSPPPPDDGPKVNTPSGPRSVAFLRAEHEAGRWSPVFGKPPGHPDCPIRDYLPALQAAQ